MKKIKNNKTYYVYKHTFPNKKIYIGITSLNPKNRWESGSGYAKQKFMHNAITKYGWNNIKHEILFINLTKEEAEQKEKELIAYYKSNIKEYGYNIDNGGLGNGKLSYYQKEIACNNIKNHEISKEKREYMSKLFKGKGNPFYNKHHTDNSN